MPKKLFISYRSLDSAKVDMLVAHLRAIKDTDGTALYDVWQDKTHIVSGQNWWDQIVDGIIGSEFFLFMVSKDAVQSPICAAELSYARKRNRPIVPIVLEGEFQYNTDTGKNDLAYWELIPQELNDMQAQMLFYEGASWVKKLERSLATFAAAPQRWADIKATKPQDPRSANDATNNPATLYARACEAAEKLDINRAETLFLKLVNGDSRYQQYAHEWVELLRMYDHLLRLEADRYLVFELPDEWEVYQRLFPKKFIALFDPKGFAGRFNGTPPNTDAAGRVPTQTLPIQTSPVGTRLAVSTPPAPPPPKPTKPRSLDLLPAPFAWIDIPAGEVTLPEGGYVPKGGQTFDVPTFKIAKYPLTNTQFATFMKADGYNQQKWWTVFGWEQRQKDQWTEPRYWQDAKWNGPEHPVVGVSWFEAVAFCQWLSETAGEKVMLATEQQWQRAAQGDKGLTYPWGSEWDGKRCNNSVKPESSNQTTPVRQYEGRGDSPYRVVDMAGNVWEWCLTSYNDGNSEINSNVEYRVLRGGSWINYGADFFRADYRLRNDPHIRDSSGGFRLAFS